MYTAMVVHESWTMREILKEELAACDCRVVWEGGFGLEASLTYRLHKPHVVLVDAMVETNRTVETIQAILGVHPKARIAAVVTPAGDGKALNALMAGAQGLVVMPSPSDVIQQEIDRLVHMPSSKARKKDRLRAAFRLHTG